MGAFALLTTALRLATDVPSMYYEDAHYYLKIARHLAAGLGSSFDGVTRTNGYHPLWLAVLVPVSRLAPDPARFQLAAAILQGLLLAGSAVLAYRIGRLALAPAGASFGALLWVELARGPALGGMEYGLQTFLLLAVALLYGRRFTGETGPGPGWHLALGGLLALLVLSRLDTVLLAATVGLALAWHARQGPAPRPGAAAWLAVAAPVLIAGGGYLALNMAWFGHPGPVSAALKREWSAWLLAHDPYYARGGWLLAKAHTLLWVFWRSENLAVRIPMGVGSFGAAAVWLLVLLRTGKRGPGWVAARAAGPFVAFSLLQVLACTVAYHGALSYPHWYYAIQPMLTAGLAAAGFDLLARRLLDPARLRPVRWPRLLLVAGLALLWAIPPLETLRTVGGAWARPPPLSANPIGVFHQAGRWLRENTPPGTRVGSWNAGTLGWVSDRAVINLDGLVNSWEFFARDRFDLCRYWDRMGITYLADGFAGESVQATIPPYRLDGACRDRLEVTWAGPPDLRGANVRVYRLRAPGS